MRNKRGYTLFELLLSIAIFSVILSGTLAIVQKMVRRVEVTQEESESVAEQMYFINNLERELDEALEVKFVEGGLWLRGYPYRGGGVGEIRYKIENGKAVKEVNIGGQAKRYELELDEADFKEIIKIKERSIRDYNCDDFMYVAKDSLAQGELDRAREFSII